MNSSIEQYRTLLRRAYEFLEEAKEALMRSRFDLACFFAEQAAQLYLKAILLKVIGDYPKTHYVRILLSKLVEVIVDEEKKLKIIDFTKRNRAKLSELEDVYIMARYSTKSYGEDDAKELIELVENLIQLVKEVIGE